jgi:hypothetical protein
MKIKNNTMLKRLIIVSFTGLIMVSCKKNDVTQQKRNSIPVAASEQLAIFKDISQNTVLKPQYLCTTTGNLVSCRWESGVLNMDINNDKKTDFQFVASLGSAMVEAGVKSSSVYVKDTSFQVLYTPLETNEIISNALTWKKCAFFNLAQSPGGYGIQYDFNLFTDSKFFAFRRVTPNDTLFGWVKLSIQDYNNMKIESYSMQK